MNCPHCGDPILDHQLACERCVRLKGYKALVDLQRHWIQQIAKGDVLMHFRRPAHEPKWHMELRPMGGMAWCGLPVNKNWKQYKRATWTAIPHAEVCDGCREVFEQVQLAVAE